MRDDSLRRSLKAVSLAVFLTATLLDRLLARATGRAPFKLAGDCQRCAACCEAPAIHVGWFVLDFPIVEKLFLAWQRHVNGFFLAERIKGERTYVFTCTHFDRQSRLCDSYSSRPGMCRDYPRALLYQPHPELLPGCGYRPLARNAKRMLKVLDAQPLTPEQLAKLKKGMFLE
ncbi:MAG TPA: YkgJ family cysteine cluster protein [Polyangiaceae bacterium]